MILSRDFLLVLQAEKEREEGLTGFQVGEELARQDYNKVIGKSLPQAEVVVPRESIAELRRKAQKLLEEDPDATLPEKQSAAEEIVKLDQPELVEDQFLQEWSNALILSGKDEDDEAIGPEELKIDAKLSQRLFIQVRRSFVPSCR